MAVTKTANDTVIKTEDRKNVVHNELNTTPVEFGHLIQKNLGDKYSKEVTGFVTVSNASCTETDWILKDTFLAILSELDGKTSINYQLKSRTVAEGTKQLAKDGKAMKITLADDVVTIGIYIQSAHDKSLEWRYDHGYKISREEFDAYALVVANDVKVAKLEQQCKAKENSSLTLG